MTAAPGLNILLAFKGWRGTSRAEQYLLQELAEGREHPKRARERLGESGMARPQGPLVWMHAHDDAQAIIFTELTRCLSSERGDLNFLITTAKFAAEKRPELRLPPDVLHQYLPYDIGPGIKAFLNHWGPDAVIWSDQDLHPRIIEAISVRKVPLYMINARMADERQHRWRWFPGTARALLRRFEIILASDEQTAANLRRLGLRADMIEVTGPLKQSAAPLSCVESEREEMSALLESRPVWLAAGVDKTEESAVIAAQRRVMRRSHRLLLILVPGDPTRGTILRKTLEQDGWIVAQRSLDEEPGPDIQIYIADVAEELGLWFRLSPVAFMGKSLSGTRPAQDPFEAAALGSAVLYGPNAPEYRENFRRLQQVGAAMQLESGERLAQAVETLLAPDKAAEMAMAAWDISTSGAEVSDRIGALVLRALDERGL